MLRSSLWDFSDAYILIKGNIIHIGNRLYICRCRCCCNNANKKVIFKNCARFIKCISKINHIQIDNVEYIDIVMPMYNLTEYSVNYSKTSASL